MYRKPTMIKISVLLVMNQVQEEGCKQWAKFITASWRSRMTYTVVDLQNKSENWLFWIYEKVAHNYVASQDIIRKFRVSYGRGIYCPIIGHSRQNRFVHIVNWEDMLAANKSDDGMKYSL